jgi:hypothetical protein
MTNTIQQLKEEIMGNCEEYFWEDLDFLSCCSGEMCGCGGEKVFAQVSDFLSTALDKVIKATADAMVGEGLKRVYDGNDLESARVHYHRAFQNWDEVVRYEDGYKTRIAEEKALRDEITQ